MSALSSTPSIFPSLSTSYTSTSSTSSSSSSSTSSSPTPSSTPTSTTSTTSSSTTPLTYSTSSSTTTSTSAVSSTSSTSASFAVDQPSSSVTSTTSTIDAGPLSLATVSSTLALTSGSPTPSTTTTLSSSSDFFSSKGAVAGTFTVVGLVGIAAVIAVVLFIVKRRAKTYEEDTEFLDKIPDFSADRNHVTSMDDMSSSDHTHFGAPPMALASTSPVFYPDHAVPYPQAFQAESFPQPPSHGYPSAYPAEYTQQYPAQYIYSPEDYDIAYPPVALHGDPNMHDPHGFAGVQVESAPAPWAQPDALRPSTKSTLTVPAQRADSRFSVDSFYTGIAPDSATSAGQAL